MRSFRTQLIAVLVVLTLVATGCAIDAANASSDNREANIELTMTMLPGHGLQRLIDEWEREHPGVRVTLVERPYDAHHEWLREQLDSDAAGGEVAAGDDHESPDIAMIEVAYAAQFQSRSSGFVDLDAAFGASELDDNYLDWRWQHGVSPDGQLFGIPTDLGGLAVAYRTDLFAEAGLPTDPGDVAELWPDWESFIEVGHRFVAESDMAFIDDAVSLYEVILNQSTTQYYGDDGELIVADNPVVSEAWRVALGAVESKIDSGFVAFSEEWNTAMANGSYAVLLAPAWMMSYIRQQAPATAGRWNITSIPGDGGNWGGSQLAIPASSDEPELAWSLISFVLGERGQLRTFLDWGNFPSIPALFNDPALISSEPDFFSNAPVGRIYANSALELRPTVLGEHQRQITIDLGDSLRLVRNGADPDQVWADAIDAIEELHRN